MRFPFRDVIPSRVPPTVPALLLAVAAGLDLWTAVTWTTSVRAYPAMLVSAICLVSFGETLEDQIGRARLLLLTALAVCALALRPTTGLLAPVTGAWIGGYLSLFAHSKLLVWVGPRVLEVPALFVAACWSLTTIAAWPATHWPVPTLTLLLGLASGRLLRRAGRGDWAHYDRIPVD
jgi:membrane associated rhomboid family serine protease